MRTAGGEPLHGQIRLPELEGVAPKQDPAMDTTIRLLSTNPLLVFGSGAAGMLLGAGSATGVLRRIGGGVLGATLGLAAGVAVSALSQRLSGRSSSATDAHVRDVAGATSTPRTGAHGEQLRVMDWNLRQFTGPSSAVGFSDAAADAIVSTIEREHPDVLVLQEVAIGAVESGRTDQLELLARRLGADDAVFVPNGRRPDGGAKGNAVLTFDGAKIQDARGLHMPDPQGAGFLRRMKQVVGLLEEVGVNAPESWKSGYFPRTVGDVIVTTAGGTDVRVLDAHLSGTGVGSGGTPGSTEAQERQLVPLAATVDAWKGPTILTGDFNINGGTAWHDFERRTLDGVGLQDAFTERGIPPGDPSLFSFSASNPTRNIDRAYVSDDFEVRDARVLHDPTASGGSDHLPVVTDLVIE